MSSPQEIFEGEVPEQRKKRLHNERQAHYHYEKRQKRPNINWICTHYGAKFWIDERNHNSSQTFPSFEMCCAGGKVSLLPLLEPPTYLL
ncbi:hypothetical protein GLOIN_2v1464680 [Rhizophagus irregularis DAOM 181602=DAOM 197198]|nr:hypothetical protein GLOIN_2v1464680 [Rhizophagus irregularis DAOM 181602=DAOM 197198]